LLIAEVALRVTLEPVTIDNFQDLIEMRLPPEQDRWLANNAGSIAQARFHTDWRMHAIYCDGTPAGFLQYDSVAHDEPGHYAIYRFMAAHERQGQGIGHCALRLPLDELRARPDARRITICCKPDNLAARRLYLSCGFAETGIDADGEMIAEIRLDAGVRLNAGVRLDANGAAAVA
jgi:diamine N-acetyltransferase